MRIRKRKTIFYMCLESAGTKHDRWAFINGRASLAEFWNWMDEQRGTVKGKVGDSVIVTNAQIFR
jgi:hypothetical protein